MSTLYDFVGGPYDMKRHHVSSTQYAFQIGARVGDNYVSFTYTKRVAYFNGARICFFAHESLSDEQAFERARKIFE